ncbi:MAG: hypothetical protein DRJ03_07635 [Chloroflexi bacterium]|nr:MAG: hypothetical protein DRJ03_07635 [Chloroflexota bacterium]
MAASKGHAQKLESEIMRNRLGSSGAKYVYAELDALDRRTEAASTKLAFYKAANTGLVEGLGKGIGSETAKGLRNVVVSAGRKIRDRVVLEPKREKILDEVLGSDPTVSAYEEESPGAAAKAYSSMRRFAPELSTDPNVVASYLRESAQTGGATNYLTIKQLADTEAAINKAQGRIE